MSLLGSPQCDHVVYYLSSPSAIFGAARKIDGFFVSPASLGGSSPGLLPAARPASLHLPTTPAAASRPGHWRPQTLLKKPFPREERADDRCPVGLRDAEWAGPVNHLHWKLLTAAEPFWSHLLPQLPSALSSSEGAGLPDREAYSMGGEKLRCCLQLSCLMEKSPV